jgi:hypothetical protein
MATVGWASAITEWRGFTALELTVTPGAGSTGIWDFDPWRRRIAVRVEGRAREGGANRELVRYLADLFDLPERDVEILQGGKSRQKKVGIRVGREGVEAVLEGLLGGKP